MHRGTKHHEGTYNVGTCETEKIIVSLQIDVVIFETMTTKVVFLQLFALDHSSLQATCANVGAAQVITIAPSRMRMRSENAFFR